MTDHKGYYVQLSKKCFRPGQGRSKGTAKIFTGKENERKQHLFKGHKV